MPIARLYTGEDGQSHIEQLELDTHPELAAMQSTTGIVFRRVEAGHFSDWHCAPRRQFVITLDGEVEIGLGDGSVHRFSAGQAILAEDLIGQGHTTRAVGDGPRLTATIPLDK